MNIEWQEVVSLVKGTWEEAQSVGVLTKSEGPRKRHWGGKCGKA